MISILEVKKGDRVRLRGTNWEADVWDNCVKQHTRVCLVYGFETEAGSVYSTDIARVLRNGIWEKVEHTPNQIKNALLREKLKGRF